MGELTEEQAQESLAALKHILMQDPTRPQALELSAFALQEEVSGDVYNPHNADTDEMQCETICRTKVRPCQEGCEAKCKAKHWISTSNAKSCTEKCVKEDCPGDFKPLGQVEQMGQARTIRARGPRIV